MGALDWDMDHLHIYASDPAVTIAWLTDGLGGEVVHESEHSGYPKQVIVRLGGQLVQVRGRRAEEQFADVGRRTYGLDHFGLTVDDLDAALAELRTRGIEPVRDFEQGFGAASSIAFLRGPDGLWVELLPSVWSAKVRIDEPQS